MQTQRLAPITYAENVRYCCLDSLYPITLSNPAENIGSFSADPEAFSHVDMFNKYCLW